MKILAPAKQCHDNESVFGDLLAKIKQWVPPLPQSSLPYEEFGQDFLLGSSRIGDLWIFAAFPLKASAAAGFSPRDAHLLALLDPPKQEPEVIAEILLRVHKARMAGDTREQDLYDKIISEVPFPVYQPVKLLLPEAPREWHDLPVELFLDIELSEQGCLSRWLFEEFKRDSFEDALKVLYGPRIDFILIGYGLAVREVVPFVTWDVDWPLSRRGKEAPTPREKVQGAYPWEFETSPALLYIYQHMRSYNRYGTPPAFGEPLVRLRVAGRSAEDAVANYHQCAKGLRRIKKSL